jgi:N-acetylmuramoyl-L-alanine amidase CwlA
MGNIIPGHVTWKILKTGTVLLNLNNGAYYTLNRTASEIWDNIIAEKNRDEIVSAICEIYDCSAEQAEHDVNETFTFLLNEGLLEGGDKIKKNHKEV